MLNTSRFILPSITSFKFLLKNKITPIYFVLSLSLSLVCSFWSLVSVTLFFLFSLHYSLLLTGRSVSCAIDVHDCLSFLFLFVFLPCNHLPFPAALALSQSKLPFWHLLRVKNTFSELSSAGKLIIDHTHIHTHTHTHSLRSTFLFIIFPAFFPSFPNLSSPALSPTQVIREGGRQIEATICITDNSDSFVQILCVVGFDLSLVVGGRREIFAGM